MFCFLLQRVPRCKVESPFEHANSSLLCMLLSFLLIQFVQLMNDSLKQYTDMVWGVQGVFGSISFSHLSSVSNMNNVHNTFFVTTLN